jgi:hypothetical protein
MHPAAKPVQKGSTFWNASAQRNAGTATIGWIHQRKHCRISAKANNATTKNANRN